MSRLLVVALALATVLIAACGGANGAADPLTLQGAPAGLPSTEVIAPATLTLGGSPLRAPEGRAIASLEWDWGDGVTSATTPPDGEATHTYSLPGLYTIGVTAILDDGQRAALQFEVRVVAAAGAVPTFDAGKSPTAEVHVALTGDDDSGDGTAANPYRSISRGARDLAPGTALRIHAGTYSGGTYLSGITGSADQPIWIGGAPGEATPVIQGDSQALHLSRVRYLVLHDLEVSGATANGINCDDGGEYADPDATRFVVFRDLFIHDVGTGGNQDGLKLSGVDDYVVVDCRIERTSASGIDHVGCHRGVIARCRFEQTGSNAIQCKGGTEDLEIRWCTLIEPGPRGVNIGGSTGKEYFRPPLSTTEPNFEARNVRVVGNLIRGGDCAFAFVGAVDCVAAHNTIVQPHNWLFRILQETTSDATHVFFACQACEVTNNLFYFERADLSTWVNIGANTQPGTFTYRNNLWYAFDEPAQSSPSQITTGENAVIGLDPGLTAPASEDVTLATNSPARGAGVAQEWLTHGLGGGAYTQPPNIGARE